MFEKILQFLPYQELPGLSLSCKDIKNMVEKSPIWKKVAKKLWGSFLSNHFWSWQQAVTIHENWKKKISKSSPLNISNWYTSLFKNCSMFHFYNDSQIFKINTRKDNTIVQQDLGDFIDQKSDFFNVISNNECFVQRQLVQDASQNIRKIDVNIFDGERNFIKNVEISGLRIPLKDIDKWAFSLFNNKILIENLPTSSIFIYSLSKEAYQKIRLSDFTIYIGDVISMNQSGIWICDRDADEAIINELYFCDFINNIVITCTDLPFQGVKDVLIQRDFLVILTDNGMEGYKFEFEKNDLIETENSRIVFDHLWSHSIETISDYYLFISMDDSYFVLVGQNPIINSQIYNLETGEMIAEVDGEYYLGNFHSCVIKKNEQYYFHDFSHPLSANMSEKQLVKRFEFSFGSGDFNFKTPQNKTEPQDSQKPQESFVPLNKHKVESMSFKDKIQKIIVLAIAILTVIGAIFLLIYG